MEAPLERETIEYAVVVVGAGPAGLSTTIRVKQLATEHDHDIAVCSLQKDPRSARALRELTSDWR